VINHPYQVAVRLQLQVEGHHPALAEVDLQLRATMELVVKCQLLRLTLSNFNHPWDHLVWSLPYHLFQLDSDNTCKYIYTTLASFSGY